MPRSRPPRADARRNRERVLDTAKEVFAAEGRAGALQDIAARAGVGAGTVYRHFPTKEALYAAVISARLTDLLELVPGLPDNPPGTRLFAFWRLAVEQASTNVALCELVTGPGQTLEVDTEVRQRYLATLSELVDHAHHAGRLRDDLTTADIAALLAAAATAEAHTHDAPAGRLADLIADLLAGTRSEG